MASLVCLKVSKSNVVKLWLKGPSDPHDIVRLWGQCLAEYIVNEIQEVYRLQGVKINDKHIGSHIRQMLRKVVINPVTPR